MKSKISIFIAVLMLLSIVIIGCSSDKTGSESGRNSAEKSFLSIGTGGTGGAWYGIMAAAGTVLNQNSELVNLDVQATGGSVENMKLLKNKTAQLGAATPDVAYYAYEGGREFDESNPNLRAIMAGNNMYEYIMVRADSDIHSFNDLKDKIISIGAPGSGTAITGEALLNSLKVTPKEIKNLAHSEASAALQEGSIDGVMALSGIPFPAATELTTITDVRFVPLSDEEINKVIEDNPYWFKGILPKDTYKGQEEDVPGIGVGTVVLTDKDTSDDVIYNLLKTLLKDNKEDWVKGHNLAEEFSIDMMKQSIEAGTILMPIHPGAKKFYEEEGIEIKE
jgi:uncharacterized protein